MTTMKSRAANHFWYINPDITTLKINHIVHWNDTHWLISKIGHTFLHDHPYIEITAFWNDGGQSRRLYSHDMKNLEVLGKKLKWTKQKKK